MAGSGLIHNYIKSCKHEWIQVEGNYGLMGVMDIGFNNDQLVFDSNKALPVVAFVCKKCGELKFYSKKLMK